MRILCTLSLAAFAAIAACDLHAGEEAAAPRVMVTVKAIKASGERKGMPDFDAELTGIRSRLNSRFRGYNKYQLLERQAQTAAVKAPGDFKFAVGMKVTITVESFSETRCTVDVQLYYKDKRVGGFKARTKPGRYDFVSVVKPAKNEVLIIAFKIKAEPAKK